MGNCNCRPTQNGFELSVAAREAFDQGQHVLWNVAAPGFSVHLGGQVIGRVLETLGGDGADEKIEVIDDFLGEPPLPAFEGLQAGHEVPFGLYRRLYTPIKTLNLPRGKRFFSQKSAVTSRKGLNCYAEAWRS